MIGSVICFNIIFIDKLYKNNKSMNNSNNQGTIDENFYSFHNRIINNLKLNLIYLFIIKYQVELYEKTIILMIVLVIVL